MPSYRTTDVFTYLKSTEKYLKGDLNEIHKLAKRAEKKEAKLGLPPRVAISGLYPPSSTTQTTSSTLYPNSIHRLTIPITLALFSTVDYIGYLVGANSDPVKTYKNFQEFFTFSNGLGFTVTTQESDLINSVFRQGITHVYFPKLNVGISYHSGNPNGKIFFKELSGLLVLNINELENIVMAVLKNVLKTARLYTSMEAKYQSLVSDYRLKHSAQIASISV